MADGTHISWADATWNPITGCSVVSPGCTNCYAMKLAGGRLRQHPSRAGLTRDTKAGPVWTGEVRFNHRWLNQPIRWRTPRDVFVCAHSDLFHPAVTFVQQQQVMGMMCQAFWHRMLVLTKRPDRMFHYMRNFTPMSHIWLGVSVEDQERADERHAALQMLADLGWKTWVSYEPALGPVNWAGWKFVRFVVSGGESDTHGRNARPSSAEWHRATRDYFTARQIPYHFKQWGAWIDADHWFDLITGDIMRDGERWQPVRPLNFTDAQILAQVTGDRVCEHLSDGTTAIHVGKHAAGALLDGIEHRAMAHD